MGCLKVNVDAAPAKKQARGAVAADVSFLGASRVIDAGFTDPTTMEAIACRNALAIAEDLGQRRLRVAADCWR